MKFIVTVPGWINGLPLSMPVEADCADYAVSAAIEKYLKPIFARFNQDVPKEIFDVAIVKKA